MLDWRAGECEPIPGKTMPRLVVVDRDYPAIADKMAALGPMVETVGLTTKGVTTHPDAEVEYLRGVTAQGQWKGRRATVAGQGYPRRRGDSRAVGYHERAACRRGVRSVAAPHRH